MNSRLTFIYKKLPQNDIITFVFICTFVYIMKDRDRRVKGENVSRSFERKLDKLLTLVTSGKGLKLEIGDQMRF